VKYTFLRFGSDTLTIITQSQSKTTIFIPQMNSQLSELLTENWFDIEFWKKQNAVTGSSVGRNVTWFVGHQNDEWVLRHYYRGGLIENILGDKYLFLGNPKTRCYRELELLELMFQQGLPVPKPIAARIKRFGLYYRADILIEKISNALDLVAILSKEALTESEWHLVGAMIGKFHEAGIYHSDLNAHNILLDSNRKAWLIDFDKCDKRPVAHQWQQANLARLLRSFNKESLLNETFHFDKQAWQWLMDGYENFYHLKN